MSTEDNKTLVRRFYKEVLEKRNPALVDELLLPTTCTTIPMCLLTYPPAKRSGRNRAITRFLPLLSCAKISTSALCSASQQPV